MKDKILESIKSKSFEIRITVRMCEHFAKLCQRFEGNQILECFRKVWERKNDVEICWAKSIFSHIGFIVTVKLTVMPNHTRLPQSLHHRLRNAHKGRICGHWIHLAGEEVGQQLVIANWNTVHLHLPHQLREFPVKANVFFLFVVLSQA
jgi:hypothetical protein